MSLSKSAIKWLLKAHKENPFQGPVLTLGNQMVFMTLNEVINLLEDEKIIYQPLPCDYSYLSSIPNPENSKWAEAINVSSFFKLLGIDDIDILDIDDYEGANLIFDLNLTCLETLPQKYHLILDGGTLEHIFKVNVALDNLNYLLCEGGQIIHMSPSNGYIDHGYYQFSPRFYFEYYSKNSYDIKRLDISVHPKSDINIQQWEFYEWDNSIIRKRFISEFPIGIYFIAKKNVHTKESIIPYQLFSAVNQYKSSNKAYETKPWGCKYLGKF